MTSAAVFVLVGPDDLEVARTRDLLTGLWRHEADIEWVVLVDDVPGRLGDGAFEHPATCKLRVIDNPRRGRGRGRFGGLCVGALAALQLLQSTDARFVLKIDTDALVIGPFADAIDAEFRARPGVGALGSIGVAKATERFASPFAVRRATDKVCSHCSMRSQRPCSTSEGGYDL